MRLPERFHAKPADEALHLEVEAELAVIDAALAGEQIPEGSDELAQLARELRDERAQPDVDFAAQLDRWAANGFERAQRPGAVPGLRSRTASRLGDLRRRAASTPPRRFVAPAGATLMLVVVAGVALSQGGGTDDSGDGPVSVQPAVEESGGDAASLARPESAGGSRGDLDELGGAVFDRRTTQNGTAAKAANRRVARDADLVLASDPEDIPNVADGVNEVVNRFNAFVTSSSVQSGDRRSGGGLGAQFRMRIPAKHFQPALAALSELAHVRSRTEGTEDITGRFRSARERIEEAEAARAGLLERLANAVTDEEADAIRAQLRITNNQLSNARADLDSAEQRVRLVPVTVSIVPEEGASDRDDGGWGVDDALDDASEVLSAAAGVLIVAGAVLLPLGLVALLAALALRTRASRDRERALDDPPETPSSR
jgi:hypothetical protein